MYMMESNDFAKLNLQHVLISFVLQFLSLQQSSNSWLKNRI